MMKVCRRKKKVKLSAGDREGSRLAVCVSACAPHPFMEKNHDFGILLIVV